MPSNYNLQIFIIQIIIIICLGIITIWLLLLKRSINFEKRIGKYAIDSIKENNLSFFDKISIIYDHFKVKLTKFLYRLKIFNEYSKKYEKYIDGSKKLREDPMDYISNKIFTALATIVIIIISDVLQYNPISMFQIVFAFLVGFFIPDLFLISKKEYQRRQIENELLKAIIIMNNAFKSGRSTMQAILLVSTELDGALGDEFKKMYIDLTYGLELETVFKRFSKRINVKEAKYITTSLTILNKTGGNIIKVFASIERSFFNRRKLQEELKALTASAAILFRVLIAIPVFIFLVIFVVNPAYFHPLVSNALGLIILTIIIVLYVVYIIIVKKVMKIKE